MKGVLFRRGPEQRHQMGSVDAPSQVSEDAVRIRGESNIA